MVEEKEKEKDIRANKSKQVMEEEDDNTKDEEIITIFEKDRSSNTKKEKEDKESIKIINKIFSESKDSIISDEDFDKRKLVEEQATLVSDKDFNEGKLREVDSLVKEIELLNYRRNRNFHMPCVIQGQTSTTLCDTGATINIIPEC